MSNCFVIQPFDGDSFDKRYEDILVPAIRESLLEPYRVDRDPSVTIPIEDIQNGIKNADVCLADITLDNPNVWFELGFAIASQKDVVLICSEERKSKFPFDVQHRKIITYSSSSPRDFEHLKQQIHERLTAITKKQFEMGMVTTKSPIAGTEGLAQHEMTLLVAIAQNVDIYDDTVSAFSVRQDMSKAGFAPIAVSLGLDVLNKKGYIEFTEIQDHQGENYKAFKITHSGMTWLHNNIDKLVLTQAVGVTKSKYEISDDDLPF
ncbi:hypothetical protein QW71_32565 [Paenibacillus sp. IHB B 3415]|uniref:hypothetical protein n=1 Tax=Paenibacillus sp. IHB B 3415 TaxID=867080 RepID=UPI0005756BA8|nr:hypothetical protein [Paenibacillus sp. IHB B 3415]KHL91836.1 hypothetical protein QW71_32565 [Paenibacillus sp. IHB B 3415]